MDRKPLSLKAFALVTLLPVSLLGLGLWQGGWVLWLGFLYMGFLVLLLDQILPLVTNDATEGSHDTKEFPGDDALLVLIGLSHFLLLPGSVWAVAGPSGLSVPERIGLFLGAGYWIGQVAHPAAHELIHRGRRALLRLGTALYVSILIGHHSSAHRLVHHRHVATDEDPNSAPAGMGFWTFAPKAWIGSFRAGHRAETKLRQGQPHRGLPPYAVYIGGAVVALVVGYLLAGWAGLLTWLGLSLHAQLQLLLADYVQHYGLRRRIRDDGRPEPVDARHSWNSPHWFSSALMLNAPRHSDHHAHPGRSYPNLRLSDDSPMLPWPLPLAGAIAMFPRMWKRRMKPHVQKWAN